MRAVLYTDEDLINITPWVTEYFITRSILEPYETAGITLKIPFELQKEILPSYPTGGFSLDTWVVIYEQTDDKERAVFLGVTTGYSHGLQANEQGLIDSRPIHLNCESWLYPLKTGQIFLSSNSPAEGHILDITNFWKRFKKLGSLPFQNNNIGEVFAAFYKEVSQNYRPPTSLTSLNLSSFDVINSENSALDKSPSRSSSIREVFGIAFHAVSSLISRGTAFAILRDNFQPDPNLIELFTALEPTDTPTNPLEKKLNARPVLIYRFKPFAFGMEAFEIDQTYVDTPEEAAIELKSDRIYSVDYSQRDQDRINGVFINTPLTPSRNLELFGLAGNPYIDTEDINRAGLRFYSGQWPFFPQGQKHRPETYGAEIQKLIDLSALITKQGQYFLNGTIRAFQDLSIQAGRWLRIDVLGEELLCYIETVTHQTTALDTGVVSRSTTIEFTRGFYA